MKLKGLLRHTPSLIACILLLSLLLLVIPSGHALWMKTLGITGSVNIGAFTPTPVSVVAATVEIYPNTLQKCSQGIPIIAGIALPEPFDAIDIDITTVQLCFDKNHNTMFDPGECVPADIKPATIDDYDGSGDPDGTVETEWAVVIGIDSLMVKFERAAVIALVEHIPAPAEVEFTVMGTITPPGVRFQGHDTVRLVDPGPTEPMEPAQEPTLQPTEEPTATPTPTPTETPTPTPTSTPEPPATPTEEPTATPIPTDTPSTTPDDTPTPEG